MSPFLSAARAYEDGVRDGSILACKWVRLACERNARDRARARTEAFPYAFDEDAAVAVCQAVGMFPHIKGPDAKVIGHDDQGRVRWNPIALEPWQCWILSVVFGWKRVRDGARRFRTVLILVPRKNAKSTLTAGVALYMLTADGESGAECYSAATTREQAKAVAEVAWEMASRSPEFRDFFGVRMGAITARRLEVPTFASKFEPLSADAHTLDGLNVHFASLDELHAHKTRQVWDVLNTATGARLQPLLWGISTAGFNTAGICYEQLTYVHKLLEQTLEDETYFGIHYTIDEGDTWESLEARIKANPNYGVSVQPDDLERKSLQAKASPAAIANYLTKHLNVFTKEDSSWMPMDAWHACRDASVTFERLREYPVWIGVDLAETKDVAAVIALAKRPDGTFAACGRFYLPEDTIDRSPVAQYSGWVHTEDLIATDGNVADYARIEDDIAALCALLPKVQAVCFDRALAAQMQQRLQARLGATPEVLTVPQTVETMNPAMQKLEELVLARKFAHPGNPVLTWMASNVVIQRNHKDEIFPRKSGGKDSHNKIDGIVALLTALSPCLTTPEAPPNPYETRGVECV